MGTDVRESLPLRIGDRRYAVDLGGFETSPTQLLRQLVDDGREATDQTLSTSGMWKRSMQSWHAGTGQERFDVDEQANRYRFRDSVGINVFDDFHLTLLPSVSEVTTGMPASSVGPTKLIGQGSTTAYWLGSDGNVYDYTVATTTASTLDNNGDATDIATDGSYLYVAHPDGLRRYAHGVGPMASWLTGQALDHVWFLNGRLLVANDGDLWEVSSSATLTAIDDLPFTGSWQDATVAGGEILVADNDNPGVVYKLPVNETTGALDPAIPVMRLPTGETIQAIYGESRFLFVATNRGIRMAQRVADTVWDHGALIEIAPESGQTANVRQFAAFQDDVWFTWSGFDNSLKSGLGRLHPEVFTLPLTPAYATDLAVDNANDQCHAVCILTDGTRIFGGPGLGLWYNDSTGYVSQGRIDSGWISFTTLETKYPVSLEITLDLLDDGASVTANLRSDKRPSQRIPVVVVDGENSHEAIGSIPGMGRGHWFEVQLILKGDGTVTPDVWQSTLRAFPTPYRALEFTFPIMLFSEVTHRDGPSVRMDPAQEWSYLIGLWRKGDPVEIEWLGQSYTCYLEGVVQDRSHEVGHIEDYRDEGDGLEGTYLVRVTTIQTGSQGDEPSGDDVYQI